MKLRTLFLASLTGFLLWIMLFATISTFAQDETATPTDTDVPAETQETVVTEQVIATVTPPPFVTPTPEPTATPVVVTATNEPATPEPQATQIIIVLTGVPGTGGDGGNGGDTGGGSGGDGSNINFAYIFGSIALLLAAIQTYRTSGKFKPEEVQAIIERERANAAITKTPLDNLAVDIAEAVAGVMFRFQPAQTGVPVAAAPAPATLPALYQAETSDMIAELKKRGIDYPPTTPGTPAG